MALIRKKQEQWRDDFDLEVLAPMVAKQLGLGDAQILSIRAALEGGATPDDIHRHVLITLPSWDNSARLLQLMARYVQQGGGVADE